MSDILTDDLPVEVRDVLDATERHQAIPEPLVYRRGAPTSYFADLALWAKKGDLAARARLERHDRQMADLPVENRAHPDQEAEYRVNPNTTAGTGGEFAPPLWLNQYFATQKRPGEVIQRLVREKGNEFDLPAGASSINMPKLKAGTLVNDQTPGSTVDDAEIETVALKAQAIVYSGMSDWSIQTFEQSPQGAHLDWAIFKDAGESLDASLEEDFITGKGESAGELVGLLNMSGTNKIVNSGAVEAKVIFPELGKAMAKVGIERKMPPDAWLMGSARLAWLALAADSSEQRPLILTDNVGQEWPVASMAGIGIYLDDAITRTWEGNQEPVFCVRANDFMLWHGPVRTMVLEEPLSGSLGVRFMLYRSTASLLHRHPSGISTVTGAGMKPATEY